MKVSAWLVIELRDKNNWSGGINPVITKARQTRPKDVMAVKVTLDLDPTTLQPHVDALVGAGHIVMELSEDDVGEAPS